MEKNYESNKILTGKDFPEHLTGATMKTIDRIGQHHNVTGILYCNHRGTQISTIPESMSQTLTSKLPGYSSLVREALKDVDVFDDLIAYRIETKSDEIMVAAGEICNNEARKMKILTNLLKDKRDEWLVYTTANINNVNPIVDRLMEDDSVDCVIMTNKDGTPILTNTSPTTATNYGLILHPIGSLAHIYIKELDALDEVIVTRIITKNVEILIAPHREFNIIVAQHATRPKMKEKKNKKQLV
ncbi:hypothetical protein evm_004555 [Chilo suppressalis]|nr:hypothetical protein evm_004555 [Chilo suppressalis]